MHQERRQEVASIVVKWQGGQWSGGGEERALLTLTGRQEAGVSSIAVRVRIEYTGHSCRSTAWSSVVNILFHRTQGRIGSPVSQHTGSSRTVRRYPAGNTQLTSNALPNGNGHEQSSSGQHAAYQEHTLSLWGKTYWAASISQGPPWEGLHLLMTPE